MMKVLQLQGGKSHDSGALPLDSTGAKSPDFRARHLSPVKPPTSKILEMPLILVIDLIG